MTEMMKRPVDKPSRTWLCPLIWYSDSDMETIAFFSASWIKTFSQRKLHHSMVAGHNFHKLVQNIQMSRSDNAGWPLYLVADQLDAGRFGNFDNNYHPKVSSCPANTVWFWQASMFLHETRWRSGGACWRRRPWCLHELGKKTLKGEGRKTWAPSAARAITSTRAPCFSLPSAELTASDESQRGRRAQVRLPLLQTLSYRVQGDLETQGLPHASFCIIVRCNSNARP